MNDTPSVSGSPKYLLRAEGLVALGLILVLYWHGGFSWLLFAVLFLAPDISMLGYLKSPSIGALSYNAVHSYVGPVLLALVGVADDIRMCLTISLIWTAHIAFDRMLGYGLKYPTAFSDTHLGKIGRRAA
ncbi:MAG TPA: DUF4260 domain-containing protein [Candidatus Eremiobacteraceae bacterium]|nr:DUF4260 domain-containing protein [Candidatus Eremiobacteraceae bacterium]